jgi:hypothetical protein
MAQDNLSADGPVVNRGKPRRGLRRNPRHQGTRPSLARSAEKFAGGNLGEASIRRILAGDPTVRRASIALNE